MRKKIEMCMLLEEAKTACEESLKDNSYILYYDRYIKLLNKINSIKEAVMDDKLYTEISDLSIIKMIIENDPKELIDSVIKVNLYYRDNFSTVFS